MELVLNLGHLHETEVTTVKRFNPDQDLESLRISDDLSGCTVSDRIQDTVVLSTVE